MNNEDKKFIEEQFNICKNDIAWIRKLINVPNGCDDKIVNEIVLTTEKLEVTLDLIKVCVL